MAVVVQRECRIGKGSDVFELSRGGVPLHRGRNVRARERVVKDNEVWCGVVVIPWSLRRLDLESPAQL